LLIDEIDKADLEFPNDLLWELDQMSFYIPETHETISARTRPIVIITSNAEKELPDAFLRRCIFHYIAFPDADAMEKIVRVHHPNLEKKLLDQAMETFYMLRNVPNIQKKPSTSELIDWLQALVVGGISPSRIKQDLPFLGVLLKKNEDLDTLLSQLYNKTQSPPQPRMGGTLNHIAREDDGRRRHRPFMTCAAFYKLVQYHPKSQCVRLCLSNNKKELFVNSPFYLNVVFQVREGKNQVFTKFYYYLKNFGVPVSMNEWQVLIEALEMGMAGSSLTGFYQLCRALLVKNEAHYDRFDLAFASFFGDIETPEGLPDKIWDWLDKELPPIEITDEMRRNHRQLDMEEMKRMLEERLAEQNEEHHGGNRWVGTGGTSPFGHSGYHPGGIRIGGESRNLSAVKVAGMRRFQEYRTDETLGIRQFQIALRKLRQFTTRLDGAKDELDLDGTVDQTCKNAGRLELVWERPRVNGMKVLLLMDAGGSMISYSLVQPAFYRSQQIQPF
jgi:hypothetical protein